MFKKVLIANRGEVALRVMRACKELGVKTVAVYSTEDENTYPVQYADEKVCIGPAQATKSYLVMSNIIAAATITGADAIHPGYGFLAENADFARACADNDLVFIGPSAECIERMGDKSSARETMKACGVPTVPGSDGCIDTVEEARRFAESVGYPVLIKATAGGGGKGMREVHAPADLESHYKAARAEGNTGEVLLTYCERRLDNVVYRLGFANTRRQARQLVNHGHFTVNGNHVNIPSYLIKVGDVVAVSEKASSNAFFKKLKEDDAFVAAPKWLDRDKNTLQGKVIALPTKADIDFDIAVHLIVELYSK